MTVVAGFDHPLPIESRPRLRSIVWFCLYLSVPTHRALSALGLSGCCILPSRASVKQWSALYVCAEMWSLVFAGFVKLEVRCWFQFRGRELCWRLPSLAAVTPRLVLRLFRQFVDAPSVRLGMHEERSSGTGRCGVRLRSCIESSVRSVCV